MTAPGRYWLHTQLTRLAKRSPVTTAAAHVVGPWVRLDYAR
jgi:hypothetical protein